MDPHTLGSGWAFWPVAAAWPGSIGAAVAAGVNVAAAAATPVKTVAARIAFRRVIFVVAGFMSCLSRSAAIEPESLHTRHQQVFQAWPPISLRIVTRVPARNRNSYRHTYGNLRVGPVAGQTAPFQNEIGVTMRE
jgi:hypothetical protein